MLVAGAFVFASNNDTVRIGNVDYSVEELSHFDIQGKTWVAYEMMNLFGEIRDCTADNYKELCDWMSQNFGQCIVGEEESDEIKRIFNL